MTLLAVAAVLVIVTAGVVLSGGPSTAGGSSGSSGFDGALAPAGLPFLDFTLHDQNGRTVALHDYLGRVVVLTFMYSTCQDTCPVEAQQIRGALDDLGSRGHVPVLAVSVDPRQDTPLNANRFLLRQSMTGRMEFLLGTRSELSRVWSEYHIQPQTVGARNSDHSAFVMLLDRRGIQRVAFPDSELTPESLAHDLSRLQSG